MVAERTMDRVHLVDPPRPVSDLPVLDHDPPEAPARAWSPDGKWIVFESTASNENLAKIRPDGSGFHLISHLTPKWLYIQSDW